MRRSSESRGQAEDVVEWANSNPQCVLLELSCCVKWGSAEAESEGVHTRAQGHTLGGVGVHPSKLSRLQPAFVVLDEANTPGCQTLLALPGEATPQG